MQKIGIALVGYKFMGRAHSNALRQINAFMAPEVPVGCTVLCGQTPGPLRVAADEMGIAEISTDAFAAIARDDVQAVDIVTPADAHSDLALHAISLGKHVFCEKPLALDYPEAKRLLDAARAAGVVHQVGFNYRFAPAVQLAKKLIEEGKLGEIRHFHGLYQQDYLVDESFPLVWRLQKKRCGYGAHGDLGAHLVDLARFLVGDIAEVVGNSRTFIKHRPIVESSVGLSSVATDADTPMGEVDVNDAVSFLCNFQCGAMGMFESTRMAPGHKNGLVFEINGSLGSLRFELERINELWYFSRADAPGEQGWRMIQVTESMHPYIDRWWPAGHVIGYEHTFTHELYEFAQSIANNRPAKPDFADGAACCAVLDAVMDSVDSRGWEKVIQVD